jgi:hypothetical protein
MLGEFFHMFEVHGKFLYRTYRLFMKEEQLWQSKMVTPHVRESGTSGFKN